MVISNKFLNAAENAIQERVIKKIFQELCNIFPDHFSNENDAAGLKEVVASRKECAQLNIVTEKGIFTWLAIRHLLGDAFFTHPIWTGYLAAAGKTGDYAIGEFLNAINNHFSVASPADIGFGLSEAAFDKMPEAVALAADIIVSTNRIVELVGVESSRQYFLETSPTVIIRNPYNAKVAELRRAIKANQAAIWKLGQPVRDLNESILLLTVELMDLNASIDADESEHQERKDALAAGERKLHELEQQLAGEKEKSAKPLAQLTEKNKGLMRQAEQLGVQKN